MKVEDLNNESNEMRVPQDLTGLAELSIFDQNRNKNSKNIFFESRESFN
jgi:hypothetical protein